MNDYLVKGISESVFPGACAAVSFPFQGGKKRIISCSGKKSLFYSREEVKEDTVFDLASLTKPLATSLAVLCLLKENLIRMDDRLSLLLEEEVKVDKKDITLFHLLNHCSGLPAYKPFYKGIFSGSPEERKEGIVRDILGSPLDYQPGKESVYSDPGFILLDRIVEIKAERSLDLYLAEKILKPLGMERNLFFITPGTGKRIKKENFAATENCPWRKRVIRGEVHDENTYFTGGVSGQAGLFGDAEAVLKLAEFILEMWKDRKTHPHIRNTDLHNFLERQDIVKDSTRALGFDTPSGEGSSAGKLLSRKSAGHLGFTGTSFWIDPESELVIVLLSNRIHPTRDNNRIREFRPFFHDGIVSRFF
ncbi:MAG: serine hydrolase domain-containing protein [Desulfurivibrionaceae bacterium]